MTQANEHFTPKPLNEHVPGAWNFVEPNPNAPTPKLDCLVQIAEPSTTISFVPGRLTLSAEARKTLLDRVPTLFVDQPVLESEWEALENALLEVLAPVRYITGMAKAEPWLSDPHAP